MAAWQWAVEAPHGTLPCDIPRMTHMPVRIPTGPEAADDRPRLNKENDSITGDSLSMNIDDGRAEIDNATLTATTSSVTLKGDKVVRVTESTYEAYTSEITTCDWPNPSWKLGSKHLNVDIFGYATGRHVIFYIKDIPVLYLPWMAFPASPEKRSGLLFPHFGYSKTRGAQLDIPYYWVITPSQDLLFDLDLLSRRGVGTGADYRYIRQRGSEGHLGGYQIYDQVLNRWRWQIGQSHKEIFSADANLRMDVNLTGDRAFLSDYGEKSGDYNRQSNDTTVNVLKTWQTYALNAYLKYSDDLYAPDNSAVLQILPSIGLSGVRQSLFGMPLFFDIDADITNFYREIPTGGQRMQLFPRLTLQQSAAGWLQASLSAGLHVRGYASPQRTGSDKGVDGDLLPEMGVRLSTSTFRIYDVPAEHLVKIRHELVPEITYGYLPERSQQRLPSYDSGDRMVWQNLLGLSIGSTVNAKFVNGESSEYREISRVKLTLGYSFEGSRQDLLTLVDKQRPWSDLILETDTWLDKQLKVKIDGRYNIYDRQISSLSLGLEVDDRQGNTAAAAYQLARNEVEYVEAHLATSLLKPLNLSYTARYSFDKGDFLESVYGTEYRHKCWSVIIAIHQRPGNQSYTVNFNLAGLTTR